MYKGSVRDLYGLQIRVKGLGEFPCGYDEKGAILFTMDRYHGNLM